MIQGITSSSTPVAGRAGAASARDATQLATQLLAAVLRADGLIHIPCSAAWIKPRTAGVLLFPPLNLTADHHHPPPKFVLLVAFPRELSTPATPP